MNINSSSSYPIILPQKNMKAYNTFNLSDIFIVLLS